MDYSMAALKLVCAQLKGATTEEESDGDALSFHGILFQRAWLQGVLVSSSDEDDGGFLLDDGTGLINLSEFPLRQWHVGMYVMVVGGYTLRAGMPPIIKVHKMVDLSAFPDREAMWYLEVMEAYKLFYQPVIEEEEEEEEDFI